MDKTEMLIRGTDVMTRFCELNGIDAPEVVTHPKTSWRYDVCAYYRANTTFICLDKCAHIGVAGRAWSYPGYVVDRTPYGVLQHELGHHVDVLRGSVPGAYWSNYSRELRAETGEAKITNYCPNDAEWFAEIFRLFVTNPDLLKHMRPRTYARLVADGFKPLFTDTWQDRLAGAPERTRKAAANKIPAVPQQIEMLASVGGGHV